MRVKRLEKLGEPGPRIEAPADLPSTGFAGDGKTLRAQFHRTAPVLGVGYGDRPLEHPPEQPRRIIDPARLLREADRQDTHAFARKIWEAPDDAVFSAGLNQIPFPLIGVSQDQQSHLIGVAERLQLGPLFDFSQFGIARKRQHTETIARLVRMAALLHERDKASNEHHVGLESGSTADHAVEVAAAYFETIGLEFPKHHQRLIRWLVFNQEIFGDYFKGRLFDSDWHARLDTVWDTVDGFGLAMNLSDCLKAVQCIYEANVQSYSGRADTFAPGELDADRAWIDIWSEMFTKQPAQELDPFVRVGDRVFELPTCALPAELTHTTSAYAEVQESRLLPSQGWICGVYSMPPRGEGKGIDGLCVARWRTRTTGRVLDLREGRSMVDEIAAALAMDGNPNPKNACAFVAQATGAEIVRGTLCDEFVYISGRTLPMLDRDDMQVNLDFVKSPVVRVLVARDLHRSDEQFRRALAAVLPEGATIEPETGGQAVALATSVAEQMDIGTWSIAIDEVFRRDWAPGTELGDLQRSIICAAVERAVPGDAFPLSEDMVARIRETSVVRNGLPGFARPLAPEIRQLVREVVSCGEARRASRARDDDPKGYSARLFLSQLVLNSMQGPLDCASDWVRFFLSDPEAIHLDRRLPYEQLDGRQTIALTGLWTIPLDFDVDQSIIERVVQDYLAPLLRATDLKLERYYCTSFGEPLRNDHIEPKHDGLLLKQRRAVMAALHQQVPTELFSDLRSIAERNTGGLL